MSSQMIKVRTWRGSADPRSVPKGNFYLEWDAGESVPKQIINYLKSPRIPPGPRPISRGQFTLLWPPRRPYLAETGHTLLEMSVCA